MNLNNLCVENILTIIVCTRLPKYAHKRSSKGSKGFILTQLFAKPNITLNNKSGLVLRLLEAELRVSKHTTVSCWPFTEIHWFYSFATFFAWKKKKMRERERAEIQRAKESATSGRQMEQNEQNELLPYGFQWIFGKTVPTFWHALIFVTP